jgi:hypothetical protein
MITFCAGTLGQPGVLTSFTLSHQSGLTSCVMQLELPVEKQNSAENTNVSPKNTTESGEISIWNSPGY